MHPAYSVIFFTSASGAGYGLMVWLAVAQVLGALPQSYWFHFVAFALALALIAGGLLSSMLHLGRPERALKAFSQWRTSWLSREGVLAVLTFVPIAILGLAWVFRWFDGFIVDLAALAVIAGALATVWCTGMIYASLTTIKAWSDVAVAPIYVLLALATGGVLYCALRALLSAEPLSSPLWLAIAVLCVSWLFKVFYWARIDDKPKSLTPARAIGLDHLGAAKPVEPPHTQANFVMREMGFAVARRHAEKLRGLTALALFAIPALCLLGMLVFPAALAPLFAIVAVVAAAVGVFAERWLFFAEAQHIVTLYYGAEAA